MIILGSTPYREKIFLKNQIARLKKKPGEVNKLFNQIPSKKQPR